MLGGIGSQVNGVVRASFAWEKTRPYQDFHWSILIPQPLKFDLLSGRRV